MMNLFFQLLTNGLIAGALYSLIGLGFVLEYRVSKFFNFSFAAVFTSGAYVCWAAIEFLGLESTTPFSLMFVLVVLAGVLSSTLLGWIFEVFFFRPLRNRGATSLINLLASLSMFVIAQNAISLIAGDDVKVISPGPIMTGMSLPLPLEVTIYITWIQLGAFLSTVTLCLVLSFILKFSLWGKKVRAVSNDSELSSIFGIDSNRTHAGVHALGGALAGIASIWMAMDTDLTPLAGFRVLVMATAAMVIGGVGSLTGVVVGAMIIGLVQNMGAIYVDTKWQDSLVFLLLLIFLLFRPQGLLGKTFRSV